MASWLQKLRYARKPDRQALTGTIFKALAHQTDALQAGKRALWIGCQHYTADYPALLEATGAEIWTTDIDPAVAKFGRAGRHVSADLTAIDAKFEPGFFDLALCNGVLGWGVDLEAAQRAAYRAMAAILKPGGVLLIGWNTHKLRDPLVSGYFAPHFARYELPGVGARLVVPGATHVFDLFAKV
ncbi:MAG: class I SAM-dependent methyltransferase [Caulobacterales bacterium]|jgi:SAM-dependent methyltransferase